MTMATKRPEPTQPTIVANGITYTHPERVSAATMEQLRLWQQQGDLPATPMEPDPPFTNPMRLAFYELAAKLLATDGRIAPPQPAGDAGEHVGTALDDLPGRPDQDGYTVVDKSEAIERARHDQAAARRADREEIARLKATLDAARAHVRDMLASYGALVKEHDASPDGKIYFGLDHRMDAFKALARLKALLLANPEDTP